MPAQAGYGYLKRPPFTARRAACRTVVPSDFLDHISWMARIPLPYVALYHTAALSGVVGEGAAPDAAKALESSVYEAMERCFATRLDGVEFVSGSYRDLSPTAVDPRSLVLRSDQEHRRWPDGYVQYADDLELDWVWAAELAPGEPLRRLVPAALAVLRYAWSRPRQRIAPTLSAGTATGPGLAEAALHALYELIERDALMVRWLCRLAAAPVHPSSLTSPALQASAERLSADGFRLELCDLTVDTGIPCALAAISHPSLDPDATMSIGLGANVSMRRALERAYVEALEQLVNHFDFRKPQIVSRRVRQSGIADLTTAAYYASARSVLLSKAPTACDHSAAVPVPPSAVSEFATVLQRLAAAGIHVFAVDLSPPGIPQLPLVRVLATGLQPHVYELGTRRLANPRLYTVPIRLGLRREPMRESELNPLPDPYTFLEYSRLTGPRSAA